MIRCDRAMPRGIARLISISSGTQLSAPKVSVSVASLLRLTAALGLVATIAQAQAAPAVGHRPFPAQALRGELVVGALPMALLNGQPMIVHYTREPSSGLLMDVWILNRAELANEPWPTSPAEAAIWRFDPASQRWARP